MNMILLETNRLRLRRLTSADADHLFALDNDPEVMRFINGGIPTPRAVIENDILPGFLHYDNNAPGFGVWAAVEKESGQFLGWLSFRPLTEAGQEAVLGYRLHKAAWGKGYATEGMQALVDHGFAKMGVQRVVATTYQDNWGSRRVMEKLGMRHVRSFRLTLEELTHSDTHHTESVELWDGDDVEYALTRTEWEAAQSDSLAT